ncbi:MAG: hypothetical protein ACJ76A_00530 [Actinomycetota bacterium]|jgi:hypothetical protein
MKRSNSSTVQYGVPVASKQAERRAKAGRSCEVTNCVTVLSTYNTSTTCWLHTTATRRHALAPSVDLLR